MLGGLQGGDNAPVALATALALNGAQARLKAGVGFAEAVKACSDALGWEPKSMKALFRRAQAKARMSEFKEAIGDLDLMLESEPDNADAKAEKVRRPARASAGQRFALCERCRWTFVSPPPSSTVLRTASPTVA